MFSRKEEVTFKLSKKDYADLEYFGNLGEHETPDWDRIYRAQNIIKIELFKHNFHNWEAITSCE